MATLWGRDPGSAVVREARRVFGNSSHMRGRTFSATSAIPLLSLCPTLPSFPCRDALYVVAFHSSFFTLALSIHPSLFLSWSPSLSLSLSQFDARSSQWSSTVPFCSVVSSSSLFFPLLPLSLSAVMSESSTGVPSSAMESTVTGDNFRELSEKVNWLVKAMSERMEREARVSREEVIRNPRLSSGVFSSSSTGGGGGGVLSMNPVVDPREELFPSPNPPRRQGRYTLSPQVYTDEAKEPSDILPAVRSDTLTAAQKRAGEERLLKKVKTPPTFSGNDAEDEISEVRDWVEVVDDFFDCMVGSGYDGEYALTFVKNNLRSPAHDCMKAKVSTFEDALANGD